MPDLKSFTDFLLNFFEFVQCFSLFKLVYDGRYDEVIIQKLQDACLR